MGYELKLDTRDLRGQCGHDSDFRKIKDVNYIKTVEKKFEVKWGFKFGMTRKNDYGGYYFDVGLDGGTGHVDNIFEALLYVIKDNDLIITGTAPFTECADGYLTNGVAILTEKQITILNYHYINETHDSVSVISELENVLSLKVINVELPQKDDLYP